MATTGIFVAWQEYVRDRVDKILEIHPLGHGRAVTPTFANDLSTAVAVAQLRAAKGITDTINVTISARHLTGKDFLTNTSHERFKEVTRQALAVASKTVHHLEAEMAKQNRKTTVASGGGDSKEPNDNGCWWRRITHEARLARLARPARPARRDTTTTGIVQKVLDHSTSFE